MKTPRVVIGLSAVIVAVTEEAPFVVVTRATTVQRPVTPERTVLTEICPSAFASTARRSMNVCGRASRYTGRWMPPNVQ